MKCIFPNFNVLDFDAATPFPPFHLSFSGSILESFHLFVHFLLAEYSSLFNCFPFISIFFQYWPWWCLFQTTWNFLYSLILFFFVFLFIFTNQSLSLNISQCVFSLSLFLFLPDRILLKLALPFFLCVCCLRLSLFFVFGKIFHLFQL